MNRGLGAIQSFILGDNLCMYLTDFDSDNELHDKCIPMHFFAFCITINIKKQQKYMKSNFLAD